MYSKIKYQIIGSSVICKQDNRYIGWPTIAKIHNGDLLVAFSGNRYGHVCPWGKTQLIRSGDEGNTWSEPVTINDSSLDDRDAGLIELSDGNLILSWFTSIAYYEDELWWHYPKELSVVLEKKWNKHFANISNKTIEKYLGYWIRLSKDKGYTWEKPIKAPVSSPHGPIEFKNKELSYIGTDSKGNIAIWNSFDRGKCWQQVGQISPLNDGSGISFVEPYMVEASDGKLVAMLRCYPVDKDTNFLYQADSYDKGKTWTVPKQTSLWGSPGHLLHMNNGNLLLSFSRRKEPFGQYASLSCDNGKSWSREVRLSAALNADHGYPSSVELDDGSIYTVYYEIDKPGEKTCLKATHWQINAVNHFKGETIKQKDELLNKAYIC